MISKIIFSNPIQLKQITQKISGQFLSGKPTSETLRLFQSLPTTIQGLIKEKLKSDTEKEIPSSLLTSQSITTEINLREFYTPFAVNQIKEIFDSFPLEQRQRALNAALKLTKWTNPDYFSKRIIEIASNNNLYFLPIAGKLRSSLTSNIQYLHNKGFFDSQTNIFQERDNSNPAVFLDERLLNFLSSDIEIAKSKSGLTDTFSAFEWCLKENQRIREEVPKVEGKITLDWLTRRHTGRSIYEIEFSLPDSLLRTIANQKVKLIHLEGIESSLFNYPTSIEELQNRIKLFMDDSSTNKEKYYRSKLEELGLEKLFLKIPAIENWNDTASSQLSQISDSLQWRNLETDQLNEILSSLPSEYHQEIMEVLRQDLRVLTPYKIAEACKKMHKKLSAISKQNVPIPAERIFYLVPGKMEPSQGGLGGGFAPQNVNSSGGLITRIYAEINSIPEKQIITDLKQIPQQELIEQWNSLQVLVVCLDDAAFSGRFVERQAQNISSEWGDIIIYCPLFTSQTAKTIAEEKGWVCFTTQIITPLIETSFFKSLDKQKRTRLLSILGPAGDNIGWNWASFYSRPKNVFAFFDQFVAPKVSLGNSELYRLKKDEYVEFLQSIN